MDNSARITATGMISCLGNGVDRAAEHVLTGRQPPLARYSLDGFEEPLAVPYQGVHGGPEAASERLEWLLDEAMADLLANVDLDTRERSRLPVFIGSSCYGIGIGESRYRSQLASEPEQAMPLPLDGFSQIAAHLRRRHGLWGPDFSLNTACTATANAILSALTAIRTRQCERALIVGLEVRNSTTLSGFHGMQLLAGDVMRPFDRRRDGLVLGEGCGVLLLEADQQDWSGNRISGGASNCDTYSISASNPDGGSIESVMRQALADAGIHPVELEAIKAHGTATPLNDNGEVAGMRRLFDEIPDFFSFKSTLGHTLGSCGVMETILMDACLHRQTLPASAGFEQGDATLGAAPLQEARSARQGHYLLNFFGFGGNNASLVLRGGSRP